MDGHRALHISPNVHVVLTKNVLTVAYMNHDHDS